MTDAPAGDQTAKLAAARLWATNRYPYLAAAVFAAPVLPAPGLGRVLIDRWWRIHADPAIVATAAVPALGSELLHLVSHVLRDHAARADAVHLAERAEVHHWVDAADAEIADDFPTDPDRLVRSATPDDLGVAEGRLAEEYYRRGLVRDGHTADCGSGAHGTPGPDEPPPPDPDDVAGSATAGIGEDEQRLIRRSVAAEVARADADAVSDGLRRWAEDQLGPRVDWRSELAAVLRRAVAVTAGAVDYSYRRPARRTGVGGVVLPSLVRPSVAVAVVCDTSASVTDDLLGVAVGEVDGLLRAVGTREVTVLAVDDAVNVVTRATSGRAVTLVGGGGTDMAVGIEAAVARRPAPQVVVVLTDGHTPWPVEPPRTGAGAVQVVAGLLEDPDMPVRPPPPPAWVRAVAIGAA